MNAKLPPLALPRLSFAAWPETTKLWDAGVRLSCDYFSGTTFPGQAEAISAGAAQAKREHVDLLIHDADSEVTERRSYAPAQSEIKK